MLRRHTLNIHSRTLQRSQCIAQITEMASAGYDADRIVRRNQHAAKRAVLDIRKIVNIENCIRIDFDERLAKNQNVTCLDAHTKAMALEV